MFSRQFWYKSLVENQGSRSPRYWVYSRPSDFPLVPHRVWWQFNKLCSSLVQMLGKVRFSGRESQWPGLNEADGEGFLHRRFSINVVHILFTLGKVSEKICFCLLPRKHRNCLNSNCPYSIGGAAEGRWKFKLYFIELKMRPRTLIKYFSNAFQRCKLNVSSNSPNRITVCCITRACARQKHYLCNPSSFRFLPDFWFPISNLLCIHKALFLFHRAVC